MNNTKQDKPDWAIALEHHEEMCVERGRTIAERFNSVSERFNSVRRRDSIPSMSGLMPST